MSIEAGVEQPRECATECVAKADDSVGEKGASAVREGDAKAKRAPKVLQTSWSKSRLEKQPEIEVTDDDELRQHTQVQCQATDVSSTNDDSAKGSSAPTTDQSSSSESNYGSACDARWVQEPADTSDTTARGQPQASVPSQTSSVRSASQSPSRATNAPSAQSLTLEGVCGPPHASVCSSGCSLSRDSSTDTQNSIQMAAAVNQNPADIEEFLKTAFTQSQRNRNHILKFETELARFMADTGRTEHKFQPLSSYHRMLLHRMAIWFGLEHAIDAANKKCVMVTKTASSRTPTYSFVEAVASEQAAAARLPANQCQPNDETASQKSSSTASRSSTRHRPIRVLKRSDEHVNVCAQNAAFPSVSFAVVCPAAGPHSHPALAHGMPYQPLLLAQPNPAAPPTSAAPPVTPRRAPIDEKDEESDRTRSRLLGLGSCNTPTSTPRSHGPGSVASSTKSHTSQHSRGSASARDEHPDDARLAAPTYAPAHKDYYRAPLGALAPPPPSPSQPQPSPPQHYHQMAVPNSHRHWSSTESASLLEPPPARVVNLASMQKAGSFGGVPGIYIQLQQCGANSSGMPNSPAMPLVRQEACNHTSFGLMRQDTAVDQTTPTGAPPGLHGGLHFMGMPQPTCPCCASAGTASSTSGSMSLCGEEQSVTSASVNGADAGPAPDDLAPYGSEPNRLFFWVASTLDCVPPGAVLIDPHTGAPFVRPDGSLYRFDRSHFARPAPAPGPGPATSAPAPPRFAPGPSPPVSMPNMSPYSVRPNVSPASTMLVSPNGYALGGANSDSASQTSSADSLRYGIANLDMGAPAQPPQPQPQANVGVSVPPQQDAPLDANGQQYAYAPYVPCVGMPYVTTMFVPLAHFANQQNALPFQWLANAPVNVPQQPQPALAEDPGSQRCLNARPQPRDAPAEDARLAQTQYACSSHFYRTAGGSPVLAPATAQSAVAVSAYPTNASPVDSAVRP